MEKNNTKKKGKMSAGKMVAIGAGLAAVGAGAYYFLGPNGKKNQKKVMDLMNKIKKEAVSDMKKAKPVIKQAKKEIQKRIKLAKKVVS